MTNISTKDCPSWSVPLTKSITEVHYKRHYRSPSQKSITYLSKNYTIMCFVCYHQRCCIEAQANRASGRSFITRVAIYKTACEDTVTLQETTSIINASVSSVSNVNGEPWTFCVPNVVDEIDSTTEPDLSAFKDIPRLLAWFMAMRCVSE